MITTETEIVTCSCPTCDGRSIQAPIGLVAGTPRQVRNLAHTYVAYAFGTSPLARALTQRAGVAAIWPTQEAPR